MRFRYRFCGIVSVSVLAVAVTGCPKEKPADNAPAVGGTSGSAAAGEKKNYTIAVIPKGTKHQFWQTVNAGAQAAAADEKTDNVTADWGGPANEGNITDQVNLVENKITSSVNAIVLAATDK